MTDVDYRRLRPARGTTAEWEASTRVPSDGELVLDTTTRQLKVGDGVTPMPELGGAALDSVETTADLGTTGHAADHDDTTTALATKATTSALAAALAGVATKIDVLTAKASKTVRDRFADPVMVSPPTPTDTAYVSPPTATLISYNNVDNSGNPRFRLLGSAAHPWVTNTAFTDQLRYSSGSGGLVTSNDLWGVSFSLDGRYLRLLIRGNGGSLRFNVDGKWISLTPLVIANTGAGRIVEVDFTTKAPRDIYLEFDGTFVFAGVYIEATDSLGPPIIASPVRMMLLGDSYSKGDGATNKSSGYAFALGRLLGFDDVWVPGKGGTGFVTAATHGTYRTRAQTDLYPAMGSRAGLIVLPGSLNDSASAASGPLQTAYRAEVNTILDEAEANCPNAVIAMTSILYTAAYVSAHTTLNAILKDIYQQRLALGKPYVYLDITGYFTGTGRVGATNGTGNSDFYMSSDAVHSSTAGHQFLARVLAFLFAQQIGMAT